MRAFISAKALPTAPPSPTTSRDGAATRLALIALAAALLASGCLVANPALLRFLWPAFALLAALALRGDAATPQYVVALVAVFLLTPFLRRVVDFRAGWEAVNYLMLAPYAAGSTALAILFRYRSRERLLYSCCLGVVIASLYGCLVAVLNERLLAGLLEFLRWAVPPCLALCIADYLSRNAARRIGLDRLCLVAVPLIAAYGIVQYVYAPAWDTSWMRNSEMDSIGRPQPFQIRVFSTFNSPGSLGFFLLFGLTVLACAKGRLRWIGLVLGGAAFLLTLHRSAWLGFAVAAGWIFCLAGARTRVTLLTMIAAAMLMLPAALALPDVGRMLEDRLNTFSQLTTDGSLNDRSSGYGHFLEDLSEAPFGGGLGIAGSYQTADGGVTKVIDGGPIEIVLSLGAFGGFVYLLAVVVAVVRCLSFRFRDDPLAVGLQAALFAQFLLLSSGTTTTGEIGLFFWSAVGMVEGARAQTVARRGRAAQHSSPVAARSAAALSGATA